MSGGPPGAHESLKPKNSSQNNTIFSRIRTFNHHAFNSLGSFFSSSDNGDVKQNSNEQEYDDDGFIHSHYVCDPASDLTSAKYNSTPVDPYEHDEQMNYFSELRLQPAPSSYLNPSNGSTPTPSRSVTPQNCRSDVKSIIPCGRNERSTLPQDSLHPSTMSYEVELEEFYRDSQRRGRTSRSRPPMLSSPNDLLEMDDTPPLSPDVAESFMSLSSIGDFELEVSQQQQDVDRHRHSLEIREGKKPERQICYDTLIEDLDCDDVGAACVEEAEEEGWYGLEYTLELSVKERRASETYSYDESAGEFSKSRESWAALRKGTIHPFLQDEDYYQWKNWHRHLDREDERRKHRRGFEFKSRSNEMAGLYVAEMKTRDVYYWQLEVFGLVGDDVKNHLTSIAGYRKDPFYPPKKHNLGWYLKRSRSIASIRELKPKSIPVLNL